MNIYGFLIIAITAFSSSLFLMEEVMETDNEIENQENKNTQQEQELLNLGYYIKDIVHNFIYFTSNSSEYEFHKSFWLKVMRARNPSFDKSLREKLRTSVHIDFADRNGGFSRQLELQLVRGIDSVEGWTFKRLNDYFYEQRNESKTFHKDGRNITRLEEIEHQAKNAVKFGVGNCSEQASLAFVLLMELSENNLPEGLRDIRVRLAETKEPGDHMYLRLIDKYKNQLILDPWMNEVFLLKYDEEHLGSNWYDYCSYYGEFVVWSEAIGSGHSERWKSHRDTKKQPSRLCDWKQYSNFHFPVRKTISEIFGEISSEISETP